MNIVQKQRHHSIANGLGLVRRFDTKFLIVRGKDTLDLFNRISTNLLQNDPVGDKTCTTILVTDRAKIVDVVTLVRRNNHYYLEVSTPNAKQIKDWIEKFIITEEVSISEATVNLYKFSLFGDRVNVPIQTLHSFRNDHKQPSILLNKNEIIVYPDPLFTTNVWNFYIPERFTALFEQELSATATLVTIDTFETFRIEQGSPIYGKELTEQVNPLEAGLGRYVSMTKGCYLGQEIIARIHNYNKLQRKLVRLSLSSETAAGAKLIQDENNVGWITSVCYSPGFDTWLCLAYVKTQSRMDKQFIVIDNDRNMAYAQIFEPPTRTKTSTWKKGRLL